MRCPVANGIWTVRHLLLNYLTYCSTLKHGPAWILSAAALVTAAQAQDVAAPSDDDALARSIVAKADQVRFPGKGFENVVSASSSGAGQDPDVREYRVLSKGNENTIVMVTEPASERGQIMLMKGRDLWIFTPPSPNRFACRLHNASPGRWRTATSRARISPAIMSLRSCVPSRSTARPRTCWNSRPSIAA